MQYPSSWDKQENGTRQDTQTDLVTFFPVDSHSNASLDITVGDISDEKGRLHSEPSLKDFKLIGSTTNNVLAGSPAYKSIYTYVDENAIFKDMEIGAIKGDKAYILTYETGMNEYDKYLPIIQELINSLQITK